jgi:hypothetical protein
MVLIFSKIQRLNHPGAPNGHYSYKEQFEVSEDIAKTYIDAGIAAKVETPAEPKTERKQEVKPEPEPITEQENESESVKATVIEDDIPEPLPPEENLKRAQRKKRGV